MNSLTHERCIILSWPKRCWVVFFRGICQNQNQNIWKYVSESKRYSSTIIKIKLSTWKEQATNANGNMDVSQMHFEKWKKQDWKRHILCDSIYTTFWKRADLLIGAGDTREGWGREEGAIVHIPSHFIGSWSNLCVFLIVTSVRAVLLTWRMRVVSPKERLDSSKVDTLNRSGYH